MGPGIPVQQGTVSCGQILSDLHSSLWILPWSDQPQLRPTQLPHSAEGVARDVKILCLNRPMVTLSWTSEMLACTKKSPAHLPSADLDLRGTHAHNHAHCSTLRDDIDKCSQSDQVPSVTTCWQDSSCTHPHGDDVLIVHRSARVRMQRLPVVSTEETSVARMVANRLTTTSLQRDNLSSILASLFRAGGRCAARRSCSKSGASETRCPLHSSSFFAWLPVCVPSPGRPCK